MEGHLLIAALGVGTVADAITLLLIAFLSFPLGYKILRFSLRKSLSLVTRNRADPRRAYSSLIGALLRGWLFAVIAVLVLYPFGIKYEIVVPIVLPIAFLIAIHFFKVYLGLTFLESALTILASAGVALAGIGVLLLTTLFLSSDAEDRKAIEGAMLTQIIWHALSVERIEAKAGKTRVGERQMVINGIKVRTKRVEEDGRSYIKLNFVNSDESLAKRPPSNHVLNSE